MSLHYLLDGYNILKQIPAFRDLPLEDGRKVFLRWIDQVHPQGSTKNHVTVIFDGHPDYYGGMSHGDIRVIFSDGCSADDTIKHMVEEDSTPKNCVVVSDDKDIFLYARSLGCRVLSVAAFTSVRVPAVRTGSKAALTNEKYISLCSQEKINKELRSFWLKEK